MKNQQENIDLEKGNFKDIDYISPSYIDKRNPKYFEIDGIKYSGLLIINYNREYTELILKNLIDINKVYAGQRKDWQKNCFFQKGKRRYAKGAGRIFAYFLSGCLKVGIG